MQYVKKTKTKQPDRAKANVTVTALTLNLASNMQKKKKHGPTPIHVSRVDVFTKTPRLVCNLHKKQTDLLTQCRVLLNQKIKASKCALMQKIW